MARHFREDAVEATAEMRPAKRRVRDGGQRAARAQDTQPKPRTRRRQVRPAGRAGTMPYGEGASYRYSYPVAVPGDDFGADRVAPQGGIARPVRGLLLLLAWVFRAGALAMAGLVMLNVIPVPGVQRAISDVTDRVLSYIPWGGLTTFSVDTPFSGVFKGDVALASVVLLVLDWVLCRLRAALR